MEQELDWVRAFYMIRMQAEGLMEKITFWRNYYVTDRICDC